MVLTREDKIMCAAIAKFETLSDGQRSRLLEMADERRPDVAGMLRVPRSEWSDDVREEISAASRRLEAKMKRNKK